MLFFANLSSALFFFFSAIIFQHVSHVAAAPISDVDAHELIVFNPPITSPNASAAWAKGSVQTVKWDTSGIPHQHMGNTGVLLLGYMENDSENLDIDRPLASGFSMSAGSVNVKMPTDITARNDYFVVLFGDSGNRSPTFQID